MRRASYWLLGLLLAWAAATLATAWRMTRRGLVVYVRKPGGPR